MDSLKFSCNWRGSVQGAKIPIKLGGLQLEGCVFDGSRLSENQRDSPIVSSLPTCNVAWINKVGNFTYFTGCPSHWREFCTVGDGSSLRHQKSWCRKGADSVTDNSWRWTNSLGLYLKEIVHQHE